MDMVSISDYSAIAKILDSASREGFTDKLSASTTIVDRYWLCLLLDLKRNHSEYDQLELFPLINPVKSFESMFYVLTSPQYHRHRSIGKINV